MSSIIDKISDDIEEYVELCKHFKQKPRMTITSQGRCVINPYSPHTEKLRKRYYDQHYK